MSNWIVTIIVALCGSSALSTLISALFARKAAKEKAEADKDGEHTALIVAMRQLYYGRIKRHAKSYIAANEITTEELEDIIEEHRIYHDILGGNGYLDTIMADVKALKVIAIK